MTTRAEIDQEMKEINAQMKEMKHTRPKLLAKCRVILASDTLSEEEKSAAVMCEAEHYMDDSSRHYEEIRKIERLQQEMEKEYSGTPQRPTYCPTCGFWSPAPPIEWVALCGKWERTKRALIKKVAASILKKKAA